MSNHKVTFHPSERSIGVDEGENLLQAAMEAGIHINASCGGSGTCGKCRVRVVSGAADSVKQAHYLPAIMGIECWFGTTADCVNAAVTGRWSGGLE